MDHGDFVVVKNIENIKFTGKKFKNKKYYRHTGHPGGIKEITPENLHKKKPGEALKLAVKRMLPGGPLAKKQLTKLKIYSGNEHPHSAPLEERPRGPAPRWAHSREPRWRPAAGLADRALPHSSERWIPAVT